MATPEWIGQLPLEWQHVLQDAVVEPVCGGMSGAAVFRVRRVSGADEYLKLAQGPTAAALEQEIDRTRWLQLREMRVPGIRRHYQAANFAAVMLSAVPGTPLANWRSMPDAAITALARSLRALHGLPREECPYMETVEVRLARAKRNISRGLVDVTQFADRHAHTAPNELYRRLLATRFAE